MDAKTFAVARITRAWIETDEFESLMRNRLVARITRAWIETAPNAHAVPLVPVARITRAWIETRNRTATAYTPRSRPHHAGVD